MLSSIFLMLILSLSSSMLLASNPMSMGLTILLIAVLIAISFSMSMSSWVAFLIFLIYVGGMLVMFSYFVAITPNQTISFMFLISSMLTFMVGAPMLLYKNMGPPMNLMFLSQINIMYTKMNMVPLYLLATVLLLTMIIVVKISTNTKGPLRPFK